MFNIYYEQNYQPTYDENRQTSYSYGGYPFCNSTFADDYQFHRRYNKLQTSDECLKENEEFPNAATTTLPGTTTTIAAPTTKTLKQAIASLNVMYSSLNNDQIPLQNYTAESDICITDLLVMNANRNAGRYKKAIKRRLCNPKQLEMNSWLKHMDEWYTAEMRKECPKLEINRHKEKRVRIAQLQRC